MKTARSMRRIACRFRAALASEPELKDTFLELKRECPNGRTLRDRPKRNRLIGRLREILAHACLAGLDPKLVILDEFQRFRWVLEQSLEEGTLSHRLLATTPTLLLSATPYRMRSGGHDLEAQQDFGDAPPFPLRRWSRGQLAKTRFGELALALRLVRADTEQARASSVRRVRAAKLAVEDLLVRVMSRWERPVDEAAGGIASTMVALQPGDVAAYVAFQRGVNVAAAGKLQHRETVEYWKSAPYLFNFMRGYRVKQVLAEATGGTAEAALRSVGATTRRTSIGRPWSATAAVRMPNARGRYLAELALGKDQWRALWVPPTMPPYELQGPFAGVRNGAATKTLVFSGWKVVPPSLAGLIGYEAESARQAADATTPTLASNGAVSSCSPRR